MFYTTPLAALTAALALVSNPKTWTRFTSARTAEGTSVPSYHRDATCFCASGALRRAVIQPGVHAFTTDVTDFETEIRVSNLLDAEVRRRYPGRYRDSDVALYVNVNDDPDPELGREAVVDLFKAVRAQLERQYVVDTLVAARALIADRAHWTQGRLARDADHVSVDPSVPDACSFCAIGATMCVLDEDKFDLNQHLVRALDRAAWRLFPRQIVSVVDVNDKRGHADVLRVYDEAIASARIGTLLG